MKPVKTLAKRYREITDNPQVRQAIERVIAYPPRNQEEFNALCEELGQSLYIAIHNAILRVEHWI